MCVKRRLKAARKVTDGCMKGRQIVNNDGRFVSNCLL